MLYILWLVLSITIFIYSYGFVDLNLTLSSNPVLFNFVTWVQHLVYFDRSLSLKVFIILIISMFICYFGSLVFWFNKSTRFPWLFVSLLALIFSLAYPMLSSDIFKYLFSAKEILVYHANPYLITPNTFPDDTWIRFMRWVSTLYLDHWKTARCACSIIFCPQPSHPHGVVSERSQRHHYDYAYALINLSLHSQKTRLVTYRSSCLDRHQIRDGHFPSDLILSQNISKASTAYDLLSTIYTRRGAITLSLFLAVPTVVCNLAHSPRRPHSAPVGPLDHWRLLFLCLLPLSLLCRHRLLAWHASRARPHDFPTANSHRPLLPTFSPH
ncbi:MAG: hypothetical protein UX37_C0004G0002 [Microgenomates group bacterium GW2011_GWA2_46_16]|nr:MAG: hypothetical protein UX37_C0004G0002 [Microgenomates group bacterium GW2011_GWA2_46_16]